MNTNRTISAYFYSGTIILALLFSGWILPMTGISSVGVSAQNKLANQPSGIAPEESGNRAYFEENQGQFDKRVKYFARGTNGYSLFLTGTEAVYVLQESPKAEDQHPDSKDDRITHLMEPSEPRSRQATAVFMKLAGANVDSTSAGVAELSHKTNYFKGAEANWRTDISNFSQVRMNNVYEGVDTVWHGKENGGVQYDFVVAPNADAAQIAWEIEGAESVGIDEAGNLLINTEFGTIKQQKPFSYQETNGAKQEVQSAFVIDSGDNSKIRFEVGNYDRTKTLTIDPSVNLSNLAFSTFLGGGGEDNGNKIAVDRAGCVYLTGFTFSTTFPITPGTFDTTYNGDRDAYVAKLDASGTNLIYSTFLGGSLEDGSFDIAVDISGNAFIAGYTFDAAIDFPVTIGAYDTTQNGGQDVFVSKINAAGSALVYSTFIGSINAETATGIAIDPSGNAFITGGTTSAGYPTTVGAFDTTYNGIVDAIVTKINAAGTAIVYSTFLGGNEIDTGFSIAIDPSGNAFVTGYTEDGVTDYPTTFGAFDTAHNGDYDAFITKINVAGSALAFSTFLGGNSFELANDIAIDATGSAYVMGYTGDGGIDYPTTVGAFDTTHNGNIDVFVTKLQFTGGSLSYSTFLGGNQDDVGNGIAIDTSGNVFITGKTNDGATDFPSTAGAFSTIHNGGSDAFVTKLNPAGSALNYSTFLGGNSADVGSGIALDTSGNVFVTGQTLGGATTFPTTSSAFDNTHNGDYDAFITKLGDFSISGKTVDHAGLPLVNSAVAMSGDNTGFMLTDAEGNFYFGDTVSTGTNLVSATQLLFNFNPPNYEVFINRNKQITFVGRPTSSGPTAAFADLGGNVVSTAGNAGLPFTKLTLVDGNGNVSIATTDAQGNYTFSSLQTGGFYIVFAEREGFNFLPQNAQIALMAENLNVNFTAVPNSPRPVQDFDGDGKTDLAVFRPAEGNWYILQSQNNVMKVVNFGLNGDIPVAEDYDGDERADIAVYRPSEGNWYRLNSSNGAFSGVHFGLTEDKPVPADFDGDGKTDIAVYRPSTGIWHCLNSNGGGYVAVKFGNSEDKPVPADFDSDGKADLTVFRPSTGVWHRLNSSNGNYIAYQFGTSEDKPMAADFDGDGKPDTALFRPSTGTWYSLDSADNEFRAVQFGITTDIPVPADFNGDGRIEHAVYRGGTWYQLFANGSSAVNQFGISTDLPTAGIR